MYSTTAIIIAVKPCPYCPLSNLGEFPIPLEPPRVIGNVRAIMSCMYDISVDNVHLEYSGKMLHDTDTLEEHDIKHGSVISVCTGGVSPRDNCEAPLDEASRTYTERIDVFYKK